MYGKNHPFPFSFPFFLLSSFPSLGTCNRSRLPTQDLDCLELLLLLFACCCWYWGEKRNFGGKFPRNSIFFFFFFWKCVHFLTNQNAGNFNQFFFFLSQLLSHAFPVRSLSLCCVVDLRGRHPGCRESLWVNSGPVWPGCGQRVRWSSHWRAPATHLCHRECHILLLVEDLKESVHYYQVRGLPFSSFA